MIRNEQLQTVLIFFLLMVMSFFVLDSLNHRGDMPPAPACCNSTLQIVCVGVPSPAPTPIPAITPTRIDQTAPVETATEQPSVSGEIPPSPPQETPKPVPEFPFCPLRSGC